MEAGADAAATSVHKLGGSLTQSSILNVKGDRVSSDRVQAALSMLTTTSTSYLLLASLDAARRYLATRGTSSLGGFPLPTGPAGPSPDPGPELPRPRGDRRSELFVRPRSDEAVHHCDGARADRHRGRALLREDTGSKSSSPTCTTSSASLRRATRRECRSADRGARAISSVSITKAAVPASRGAHA